MFDDDRLLLLPSDDLHDIRRSERTDAGGDLDPGTEPGGPVGEEPYGGCIVHPLRVRGEIGQLGPDPCQWGVDEDADFDRPGHVVNRDIPLILRQLGAT